MENWKEKNSNKSFFICPLSCTEISKCILTSSIYVHFVLLFCVIGVVTSALHTPCISIFQFPLPFSVPQLLKGFVAESSFNSVCFE